MLPRWFPFILLVSLCFGRASAADHSLVVDHTQSHMEIAVHATLDSFTGKLTAFDPVIAVDERGWITKAHLAFRFRDVLTGKTKRDEAMHKWQQTDSFPDGVFDLISLEKANDHGLTAVGRLTFHGISRELRFPVSVTRDGGTLAIDGNATIDTREFELPIIRMMGMLKVDPQVQVRFHVQGAQPTAGISKS